MNKSAVSITYLVALFAATTLFPSTNAASFAVKMPASCKSNNVTYCFKNDNYPTEIVAELLSDMKNFEVAKDDDVGQIGYSYRQGGSDEYDCRSQSTTDPIYYVVDEAGRDRVVIQKEGKFEQRYSVMWCDKEGLLMSRTQHFLLTTVTDNQMSCDNKYMNYDFLVLSLEPNADGKWKMERASVKIPVCCACRYKKDD